jgi:nucleotide-binding universal stress UspA family protein
MMLDRFGDRAPKPGGAPIYVDVYTAEEADSKAKLLELAKMHLAGVKYELKTTVAQPSAAILHVQKAGGADVIVMSTHGRRGLAHVFMGSVAERVVREAQCPVLTLHGHPATDATAAAHS